MRDFSITNDHLKTVVPAQAGTQVSRASTKRLLFLNADAGGGFANTRRLLTFFAPTKKVRKERCPRVCRPSGSLRCSPPQATRKTRARTSCLARGFGLARPQTLLAESPCVCCAVRRLAQACSL